MPQPYEWLGPPRKKVERTELVIDALAAAERTRGSLQGAITLASAFTGLHKYRKRSYFLQETADSIEEEANALTLGVGEYRENGSDREEQALARFTQRVENLRNEQRRRQQQLDQPADQGTPIGQPSA
ncbi:hypothetical protein [Streptomyces sp. NPDC048473]|uniref:hypothetical protein n=1 Tax=unclassified Streptomyces TaxID=2593676 RepID=UPI003719DB34